MRLSIFEALRVPASASEGAVRSALRRLIRRLYVSARDSSGDVEEGLRFCNAASSVLLVDSERSHYEGEYANMLSGGTNLRRSHAAQVEIDPNGDLADLPDAEAPSAASGVTSVRPGLVSLLEIAGGAPASVNKGWLVVAVAFCAAILASAIALRMGSGALVQYAVLYIAIAATAAAIGIAVHRTRDRGAPPEIGARLRDVAVVKWRRERSIFMGSRLRNEEAAWVYRLRVAETDRARNVRTSTTPVWVRPLARVIDYGLCGAGLYAIFVVLSKLTDGAYLPYLASWWFLPIATVIAWIPIEAWCLHRFRRTPGKWLMGMRCRPGATSLNAPDNMRESPRYALMRAGGVAFYGVGAGLPLLNLILPLFSARAASVEYETKWDALGDAIITRVPMSSTQAGFSAAAVSLMCVGFFAMWWPSFVQTGAIVKEARQLAPQVSWGQLMRTNPKSWIPADALNPSEWQASETVSRVGQSVAGAASGVAAGVTAAVIGAPISDSPAIEDPQVKTKFANYAEQANRAIDAGNPGAAFKLCERWVVEQPSNGLAWKCYGLGLQMNARHADALQALRKAQRIDPTDRSLHDAIRISFSSLNDKSPPR